MSQTRPAARAPGLAKAHLRIVLDPLSPLKNAERRAKRRAGYYSPPMMFARFLRRLFR